MVTIRKTITLTNQQGDWVKSRIASGGYTNDSEYFRELIRQDQARNAGIEQLRMALAEGEQSGISNRTLQEIRQAVMEKLKADGQLPTE